MLEHNRGHFLCSLVGFQRVNGVKDQSKRNGAGLALSHRRWDVWGEDGKQKTRGQAERLDHTHTSKDLSCSEVMHFFFWVGF